MDSSQFMKKSHQGYLGHVENVSIQNNWILPNWSVVNLPYERAAIVESNFIKTKMVNLPKWGLRPKWFRFLSTTKSNSAMFYNRYVLNVFFRVICHIWQFHLVPLVFSLFQMRMVSVLEDGNCWSWAAPQLVPVVALQVSSYPSDIQYNQYTLRLSLTLNDINYSKFILVALQVSLYPSDIRYKQYILSSDYLWRISVV